MRIGLLGGTFDPIHTGHLILAQECWMRFSLDKVIFIPAHRSPFKTAQKAADSRDRSNMVRLAIGKDKRFELSTYEIEKKGISYTVETVEYFKDKYGDKASLFFITGSDSAESLSLWKDVDRILKMTTFVIASRPGWGLKSHYADRVKLVVMPGMDISSTAIRERVRRSEPIDYLVPAPVAGYIRKKGLYR